MNTFFECKVKYQKTMENGLIKKVTEPYLVDALSVTEAEARIIEKITPFISGDVEVVGCRLSNYAGIFFDETGARWFRCKINFITLNEKTGGEKRTASYLLVQANDLYGALEALDSGMKGTLADYEIEAVSETKIMDVYLQKNNR